MVDGEQAPPCGCDVMCLELGSVYHMDENHCGQQGSAAGPQNGCDDVMFGVDGRGYAFRGVDPFCQTLGLARKMLTCRNAVLMRSHS